jgi:hypothetical protein
MKYLLHKDFQEIAQRHALTLNPKLNEDGDLVFYDSFLFANIFLNEKHKLMMQELEVLNNKFKELYGGSFKSYQHQENCNELQSRIYEYREKIENEFWFIRYFY